MIALTKMLASQSSHRKITWFAVTSGILGIFSFACLIAYLAMPSLRLQASGAVAPMGELLLTVHFLSSMVQVLLMIPVAIQFYQMGGPGSARRKRSAMILGIVALGGVAIIRAMALADPAVSDILFMIPMGLVGIWLAFMNWDDPLALPPATRIVGGVAGVCLFGVGLNFFLNGGLVVFSKGPMAYGDDVNFHIGLGLSGLPGFTLFPVWCILAGFQALRLRTE